MSGHSKWATIKRAKGAKDVKKASAFTKISRDIAVAAQLGNSGDPVTNFLLRVPIEKARAANMSNDKIDNAIKRGLGLLKDENVMYPKTYEAYAPDGTALLIDSTTDNPTRTVSEVKAVVTKNGGKFLNEGSISWKFREVGRIVFDPVNYDNIEEEIIVKLIDSVPIEDVEVIDDENRKIIYVTTKRENLKQSLDKVMELFKNIKIEETGVVKVPDSYRNESSAELEDFIDKIEDLNDIDRVWTDVI